jgi:2',3'-cyclic-nucleotide 2'-phosphodiesterase (5'-nucleotidase family)
LYPGEITVASIWGSLPTPNELVEVDLTGPQLIEVIESRNLLVAGLTGGSEYRLSSGAPVELDAVYQVLVSDSLYTGGNYYDLFRLDADPIYLELDWRLPAGDDLTRSAPRP